MEDKLTDTTTNRIFEGITTIKELATGDSWDTILSKLIDFGVSIGVRIIAAIAVYFIGRWICKYIKRMISAILVRKQVEASLSIFFNSFVNILLNIIIIIAVIGILGIETTTFVALFGALGVAIGMALSGTLQNFAGGIIILLFKPFKIGDYIETQGFSGTVKEIQIFNTILSTPDHKLITIPNGGLSTSVCVNYSKETQRRIDWTFDIAYGDDFEYAKEVIIKLLKDDKRILTKPEYSVVIKSLDASSIKINVRVWTSNEDYWSVYFDMNEKVYRTFTLDPRLNIPFNQLDVHIKND